MCEQRECAQHSASPSQKCASHIFELFLQFAVRGLRQIRVDEAVEVAVHDSVHVAGLVVGAVVLDHGVGHEDVGADLVAPCDLVLDALDVVDLVHMLLLGDLVELCLQHLHGVVAVLELAALGLAADHDAGGLVDQTDATRCM